MARKKHAEGIKIDDKILDLMISQIEDPRSVESMQKTFNEFKKALIERMLEGELTYHLGYDKHDRRPVEASNARNGQSEKTTCGRGRNDHPYSTRSREYIFTGDSA